MAFFFNLKSDTVKWRKVKQDFTLLLTAVTVFYYVFLVIQAVVIYKTNPEISFKDLVIIHLNLILSFHFSI